MLFETGNRPETTYISNCNRDEMLGVLREFIDVIAHDLAQPRQDQQGNR